MGDSFEGAEPIFCDTDDYSGCTIYNNKESVGIQTVGCVYIHTKEELAANKDKFDFMRGCGISEDHDYVTILYNFSGDICLSITSEDSDEELLHELDPEKTFLFEYDELPDYPDWGIEVPEDAVISDTISIADALKSLDEELIQHKARAYRTPLVVLPQMYVLSYCDIPEKLTQESYLQECSPDTYVSMYLAPKGQLKVDDWIRENYPELIDVTFMIHIDY